MFLARIALNEIRPPSHAVRAEIDEVSLGELTEDVRRNGVIVPPHVKPVAGGYEIVAGHRRYLAACAARLDSMNCLVREESDASADVAKLTENLYRQELSPVEEGAFFAELFEGCGQDVDRVAARVGKSRGYVESRLLLLSGDSEVLQSLARKEITLGVAQELNRIEDPAKRHYYLGWAVSQGATTKLVRFWREAANAASSAVESGTAPRELPPELAAAAEDLFRCFICGEKEPIYDLAVLHVHRACRAIVERQGLRSEERVER